MCPPFEVSSLRIHFHFLVRPSTGERYRKVGVGWAPSRIIRPTFELLSALLPRPQAVGFLIDFIAYFSDRFTTTEWRLIPQTMSCFSVYPFVTYPRQVRKSWSERSLMKVLEASAQEGYSSCIDFGGRSGFLWILGHSFSSIRGWDVN